MTTPIPFCSVLPVLFRIETSTDPNANGRFDVPIFACQLITIHVRTCTVIDNPRDKGIRGRHNLRDGEACHRIQITDKRREDKYETMRVGGGSR